MTCFYSPDVSACTRFPAILESVAIKPLLGAYEFVKIDASKDSKPGYKYSIFRVRALIRLTQSGEQVPFVASVEDTAKFLK